jgi:hypothetical protein
VQIPRRLVVAIAAFSLGAPAAAVAQTETLPGAGAGVSTQPPVSLDGDRKVATKPRATPGTAELPNTGSDPRLLFGVGVAVTLFGVGLRLRTADADDY